MTFLDEFGKKFTRTSQTMAKKAKDVAEVSNLKLQIKEEERRLRGRFSELGQQYYALHSEDAQEELCENVERVNEIRHRIALLEERIHQIENERLCPACGTKLPENGQFCTACGAKYPEKERLEEAAVEYRSCIACGAPVLSGAKYCTKCGAKQTEGLEHTDPRTFEGEVVEEPWSAPREKKTESEENREGRPETQGQKAEPRGEDQTGEEEQA